MILFSLAKRYMYIVHKSDVLGINLFIFTIRTLIQLTKFSSKITINFNSIKATFLSR